MSVRWTGLTGDVLLEAGWRAPRWGEEWDAARVRLYDAAVTAAAEANRARARQQLRLRDEARQRLLAELRER